MGGQININTAANTYSSPRMTPQKRSSASSKSKNVYYRHTFKFVDKNGNKLSQKLKARQSYCTVRDKIYTLEIQKKIDKYKKTYKQNVVMCLGDYKEEGED